jgi:integrase
MNFSKKPIDPNDKAVNDWLNSQKRRTHSTYATAWRDFSQFTGGVSGDAILAEKRVDTEHKMEQKILDFKTWLLNTRKFAPHTARAESMAIRAFFAYHYQQLHFRPAQKKRLGESSRKTEDYRFSRDDLKKMFDVADLYERYILTVGKSFGMRAEDFFALRRGDLEPYIEGEPPISIGKLNTRKESVAAYPFIDSEAKPIIKAMLDSMEGKRPEDRMLPFTE